MGDVHGCRDELEELVGRVGPDHVVLVGDLFTKGPDPVGVYRLIREGGWRAVLGNHDLRLLRALEGSRRRVADVEAKRVIDLLDAHDRRWRAWLGELPYFEDVRPFTVVHAGLHPSGSLERTSPQMAVTMRRWPKEHVWCPPWHEVYRGTRRVIFGHDARRGLVRYERQGEPWLIGLDTGCVYGGRLSGYLVHADRVEQVEARRAYQPIG